MDIVRMFMVFLVFFESYFCFIVWFIEGVSGVEIEMFVWIYKKVIVVNDELVRGLFDIL